MLQYFVGHANSFIVHTTVWTTTVVHDYVSLNLTWSVKGIDICGGVFVVIVAQEAEAKFKFIELKEEATSYQEKQMHGHRSHSLLQLAAGPNIEVLKLAFSEYYLNLILLQNYQVRPTLF